MAEQDKKTYQVGDIVKVKPGGIVTRPDNTVHVVIKGAFYLDQPGKFLIDGTEVTVR